MKTKHYTEDGKHPEDEIYRVGEFISELTKIQETYFKKLVADLHLNKNGEDWLFDYIYNCPELNVISFEEYLDRYNIKYDNLVKSTEELVEEIIQELRSWEEEESLKTPEEWCKIYKIQVIDPDGWRQENIKWEDKIDEKTFNRLKSVSTCTLPSNFWNIK